MAGSLGGISIELEARLARFESDMGRAARLLERDLARSAQRTEKALQGMQRQLDNTARAAQRADASLSNISRNINYIQRAAATIGASFIARSIVQAGLNFERFNATLVTVTGSQSKATAEFQFLRREAERLGIYLPTLADTYMGLAAATKGTRLEGAQTREIFLAVAEAGRAFKLRADQIQGALYAVQQIASKGVVSMEELRRQLGDRIYGAFNTASRAMGLTTAEMNKLVASGQLLSEDFLPKFAAELRKSVAAGLEFSTHSPAAEFDRMKTAAFEMAVVINRSGFMDALVDGAKAATKFMNENHTAAAALGETLGFLVRQIDLVAIAFSARMISAFAQYIAKQLESAAATRASLAADQMSAAASVSKARAIQIESALIAESTTLEYRRAIAVEQGTRASLRQIQAQIAAATSKRELARLNTILAATENALAASLANVEKARIAQVGANASLIASNNALAAASARNAAAMGASAAAALTLTGVAGRLGAGLLALVGGPIGAAVIALGALAYGIASVLEGSEEVGKAIKQTNELADEASANGWSMLSQSLIDVSNRLLEAGGHTVSLAEKQKTAEQAALDNAKASLKQAEALAEKARAEAAAIHPLKLNLAYVTKSTLEYYAASQQVDEMREAVERLSQNQTLNTVLQGWSESLRKLWENAVGADFALQSFLTSTEKGTKDAKDAYDALEKERHQLEAQRLELTKGAEARKLYELAVRLHFRSVEELLDSEREEVQALIRLTRENAKAESAVKSLKSAEEDRRRAAKQDARFQRERERVSASLKKSEEALLSIIVATSAELDGPTKKALKQNADQWKIVEKAMSDVLKLGAPTEDMYNLIAEAVNNLTRASEERVDAAKKEEDIRGAIIGDMQKEIALMQMSADEYAIELRLQDAINLARERRVNLTPAMIQSMRREIAEHQEIIKAIERQNELQQRYEQIVTSGLDGAADAIADFVMSGLRDWNSLADGIRSIWKKAITDVIAETIKLRVIKPFIEGLFNTGSGSGASFNFGSAISQFFTGGSGGGGFNLAGLTQLFTNSSGAGFWSNLGSLFGIGGGGAASAATLGGTTAWGAFGPGSSAWIGLGGSAGAGAGAAAGSSGLAGAASSFGWVPIVGWIMAAMAVNDSMYASGWKPNSSNLNLGNGRSVSGGGSGLGRFLDSFFGQSGLLDNRTISLLSGSAVATRLFGRRAPRVTDTDTRFDFSESGIGGQARFRTLEEGGFFRSDRRRWHSFNLVEDEMEAGDEMLQAMRSAIQGWAQQLAADAPSLMNASLRVVQEITKGGNVRLTKYFVELLGRSWEEATPEAAETRLFAEQLIHTIDSIMGNSVPMISDSIVDPIIDTIVGGSSPIRERVGDFFDSLMPKDVAVQGEASAIAERWREDAELLMTGAQFLLQVASDIRAGFDLLETGTLTPIVDLVEELAYAGESLSETYIRLVSSTMLFDQAVALSGVNLDITREAFVRLATDIAESAGGLERASDLWTQYFDRFYNEAERGAVALEQALAFANVQFEDIGLNLTDYDGEGGPEAFRALFESLLPTLSADAIVEWLEAASALMLAIDAQDEYNGIIEDTVEIIEYSADAARQYADAVMEINDQIAQMELSEFQYSLREIATQFNENVDNLNELARAAGLSAAQEQDLARAHQLAAMQVAQAIAALESRGRDLVTQLGYNRLSQLEAAIELAESASNDASTAITDFGDSIQQVTDTVRDNINLLLGDLSPLKDKQKLPLALQALREGRIGQEDVLQIGRRLFASGRDYNQLFDEVLAVGDRRNQGSSEGQPTGGITNTVISSELRSLYAERDLLLQEQREGERFLQAMDLAQVIADLAGVREEDFEQVAQFLGIEDFSQLAEDLRLDGIQPLIEYLTALQADTYDFNVLAESIDSGSQAIIDALYNIFTSENWVNNVIPKPVLGDAAFSKPLDPNYYFKPDNPPIPKPDIPNATVIDDNMIVIGDPSSKQIIQSLDDVLVTLADLLPLIADSTGATAAGIGTLNNRLSTDNLQSSILQPRSNRFEKIR